MGHPDLNELLDFSFRTAQFMLGKHGEFIPFGVTMGRGDGLGTMHVAYTGEESGDTNELLALVRSGFRRDARTGDVRAVAVCYDVRARVADSETVTDAICADLEHECGESVRALLPYRREGPSGTFVYGEVSASPLAPQVFIAPGRGD